MMRYVGIHGYDGDDAEEVSLVVRIGDEVKEYLSVGTCDGIFPGGYMEIDGRYMIAKSDSEWVSRFSGGWDRVMDNFAEHSLSMDESPMKHAELLRERARYVPGQ